ncbi:MAG: hypothetical protein KatS3mg088_003 [Patescibacteria group bacterium]|nr:MAG: hypothetical protein KatS3mg088_003 [Patescibacteria group bacterium]
MKKNRFLLVLISLLVLASVVGCSAVDSFLEPAATPTATVMPTATPTTAPTATTAPEPTVVLPSQAIVPTPAPRTTPVATAPCILVQSGVQLKVDQKTDSGWWEFDPAKAVRVGDRAHPDASLAGCPVIIEGRKDLAEEHHIWILMPGNNRYLDSDGVFRARELSAWAYPSSWNLDDFSAAKPPIVAEFVDAKVNNMKANGYSWPIFVHLSDGTTLQFKPGDKVGAVLPSNCDFAEPSRINVTGVYDTSTKTFKASIGAEGCWTAARIDGDWVSWQNARDNVQFSSIEAWLMPLTWDKTQIDEWISQQK